VSVLPFLVTDILCAYGKTDVLTFNRKLMCSRLSTYPDQFYQQNKDTPGEKKKKSTRYAITKWIKSCWMSMALIGSGSH
jgi:hypothetical protein